MGFDDKVKAELARVGKGGAPKYHQKNAETGKLFARERVRLLLDPDSFVEDGAFANALDPELPADGVITGLGKIGGRVVAVGSYIVATAPLDPALQRELIPRGRVLSDTRRLLNYFRLSPDGRMVFGGRAGFVPGRIEGSRPLLIAQMQRIFPQLVQAPVEFAWGGHLGFTWDSLPHVGRRDGIHYALGYCGHGVALASWLGHCLGTALAGQGPMPEIQRARISSVNPDEFARALSRVYCPHSTVFGRSNGDVPAMFEIRHAGPQPVVELRYGAPVKVDA